MPYRRHHVKSRHGCVQCKAKRTKCDEIHPICTKCVQRGTVCSFSDRSYSGLIFMNGPKAPRAHNSHTHRPLVLHTATISQTPTSNPSPKNDEEHIQWPLTFTVFELDNLRLMRHFCTHVWQCIVPASAVKTSDVDLWRDIVPDMALEHPFLLHALLAVSAVHFELAKNPSNLIFNSASASMTNLAHHHHVLSLPLMRDALSEPMDHATIPPLFAAAALIAMYAFGHSLITINSPDFVDQSPIDDFAGALTMLHGMSAIVCSDPGLLEETPFKVMRPPKPTNPAAAVSPAAEGYIAALKVVHARTSWFGGQEEAKAYGTAIELLLQTFVLHCEAPESQGSMVPFAVRLPKPVLSGIREQHPLALCLIAGYATILHWLRKHLWIQDWGRRVIEGVGKRLVGSEWEEVIAWPLQVVGSG